MEITVKLCVELTLIRVSEGAGVKLAPMAEQHMRAIKPSSLWLMEWIFPDLLRPESLTYSDSAYRQLKKLLAEAELLVIRSHDLRHSYTAAPKKPARTTFQAVKGKYRKPGTGCVTQPGDHLWEGRYSPKVNGTRMARNVYAPTEAEREEKPAWLIV